MSALAGKRILITGVTSGIGHATVTSLVAAGAEVVGIGRDERRLFALAETWGPRFTPLLADLAEREAVDRAIEALRKGSDLDAIVNNAADCVYASPLATPPDRWEGLFHVNVFAPIRLVHGLHSKLAPHAHVVNVSSVNADHVSNLKFAPYGSTKAALAQITHALRMELGPRGIRVSQITPGLVETELYEKVAGFERAKEKLKEMVPRWLLAEDVARAIEWVLSQPPHVTVGDIVLFPTGQA